MSTERLSLRRYKKAVMIEYCLMDATCPLATCLHGGPIPLAHCLTPETAPAYVETVSDIPPGAVARWLQAMSARYGACGVLAVADGQVVGKIRFYPQALFDQAEYPCLQQPQLMRALLALDVDQLPAQAALPVLRLYCFQVAEGYRGRGIVKGMLATAIDWARAAGWREVRATAVQHIPPLLAWCGQASERGLHGQGFTITSELLSKSIREGVISQRQGDHSADIQAQWAEFDDLSDDDAAMTFEMTLDLRPPA